jgi:hypothetical protein
MGEIAVNQNSTIVLPVPIDLLRPFMESRDGSASERGSGKVRREEEEVERLYEEATREVPTEGEQVSDQVRSRTEPT